MTQAATFAELKAREVFDWPALWGIVWSHCEACMLAALRALDAALAEPKLTRRELRRRWRRPGHHRWARAGGGAATLTEDIADAIRGPIVAERAALLDARAG